MYIGNIGKYKMHGQMENIKNIKIYRGSFRKYKLPGGLYQKRELLSAISSCDSCAITAPSLCDAGAAKNSENRCCAAD
jgi:hypothetical protein